MSGESPDRSGRDRERESSEKTSEAPGRVPQDAKVPGDKSAKAAAEAVHHHAQGGDDGESGIAGSDEGAGSDAGTVAGSDEGAEAGVEESEEESSDDATRMLRLPAASGDHLTTELRVPADAGDQLTTELRSPAEEKETPGDKLTTELRVPTGADAADGEDGRDDSAEDGDEAGAGAGDRLTTELRASGVDAGDRGTTELRASAGEADDVGDSGDGGDGGEPGGDATTMLRLPPEEAAGAGDRGTTELPASAGEADDVGDSGDGGDGGEPGGDATTMLRLPPEEAAGAGSGSGDGDDDGGAEAESGTTALMPVIDEEPPARPVEGAESAKPTESNSPATPPRPTEPPTAPEPGDSDEPADRPVDPPKPAQAPAAAPAKPDAEPPKPAEPGAEPPAGSEAGSEAAPKPTEPAKPEARPVVPAKPAQAPPPVAPPRPEAPPPPADADRDPLELLAALTNKPAPPPTPLRTLARRVKIWTPLAVLLLIGLVVAQVLRPLPDPGLELTAAQTYTFEGELGEVPWPEQGQAQLDVQGLGSFGSSGEQEPVPIASVAKVMTAYVILRDHPMEPGTDGAVIPVDQQAEDDAGLSADGESIVDVEAGTEMTQREAIQAIMIASANNVARLLARWDADSEEAFVEKMNEAAAELGMEDTVYTDPSGLREETVSTAADQVKLAREVMKDPFFREVVRMPSYEDSRGEPHYNWNQLVPMDGVIGIKTGTTTVAGGNLLFAAEQQVGDTTQLIVGAVLSQPPHPSDNSILTGALTAGDALMRFAQGELVAEPLLAAGDVVGEVDDGLGGGVPLVVTEDVPVIGWPGLAARLELSEDADGVPGSAEAGTEVGTLTVGDGTGSVEVPVALGEDLHAPGFGARLTRIT